MKTEELKGVLERHAKWLCGEPDGARANLTGAYLARANLARANLDGANLAGANLTGAYLARANLDGANLDGANLAGANLDGANLDGAYLDGANLAGANLDGANLTGAYLARACLAGANLAGANLTGAYLARANLDGANLTGANLAGAHLTGAYLAGAYLDGAKNAEMAFAMTEILPREGEVIGWKKCCHDVLVKLRVPPTAKRSNASGRKCRAEFVEVLDVIGANVGISKYDDVTEYKKGGLVKCDNWCSNRWEECAGGIHFFLTKEEAEAYS